MIPHFQSSPYTTAASSLLTILHHFDSNFPKNKVKEFEIWHECANLPTRGCSIYALARYAKQQGLNPKVVVEKKQYDFPDYRFYRYTKEDIEHAAYSSERHLQEAEELGVTVLEGSMSLKDVKRELSKNNVILLRLNVKPIRNEKRNTSNYIVVHGFDGEYFQIIDPGFAALSVPEEVMQEAFDSLETKKYRDHRMLVFSES
tara:strand:+ start:20361 stop:20966 length:606 start_codon:yes stop_codon:yes gene_type:complete